MEKCVIACNLCPTCFDYTLVIIEDNEALEAACVKGLKHVII